MAFNNTEENEVDFTKTFDLTGNDNDEMLKLYLRKAGLSDNIEYLTSEQRRAFIYDIVKSNKNPGYWKPSVLPQTPTPSRAPFHKTPVDRESSITLESIDDIPPASTTFDLATYRQVKNAGSYSNGEQINLLTQQKANTRSTLYERQFSQKMTNSIKVIDASPIPLPTTTIRNRKGKVFEISSPKNFRHLSGDMTRDMTKNTFDLSGNVNNNSLKKYMIERGITEEDVSGLDRKDLIRRIVQSNYTWMPTRTQRMGNPVPPPPSETYVAAEPVPAPTPRNINISRGGAIIVAPPVLPGTIEPSASSDPIYEEIFQPKRNTTSSRTHRRKPLAPPPPPPVPVNTIKTAAPVLSQQLTNRDDSSQKLWTNKSVDGTQPLSLPMPIEQNLSTHNCTPTPAPPPPPPPPRPIKDAEERERIEGTLSTQNVPSSHPPPPPPPPPPTIHIDHTRRTENFTLQPSMALKVAPRQSVPIGSVPLPTALANTTGSKLSPQIKPRQNGGEQDRNAFLESIRCGVTLKKVTSQDKQFKNNVETSAVSKQSQQLTTLPATMKHVPLLQVEKPDFMSELRSATLKRIKKLENNPYASESEC